MPTPNTNESWLADYGWLSANLPPNCTAEWRSRFFSLGAGIYSFNAAMLAPGRALANGITPGLTANQAAVLAEIRQFGATGCALATIAQKIGMTEPAITRTAAVLIGKKLIDRTPAGLYIAADATNVQGIGTKRAATATARPRGRPRATAQRAGAAA